MFIFRKMKKRSLLLWTLLLSMALLCAQGVKLHVHSLDQEHDQELRHSHIAVEITTGHSHTDHSHLSKAHLSTDISHSDHHEEMISELDVTPYGLMKKVSSYVLTLALLTALLALLVPGYYRQVIRHDRIKDSYLSWRYHLSPPLRAPPL